MKLLKPGVIPPPATHEATCPHCLAKMEYDKADVREVGEPGRRWTPPERRGRSIDCCFCGKEIVLAKAVSVPTYLAERGHR